MMYNTDFTEDNKYRGHRAQQLVGKSQSDSVRAVRDDGTLPVHVHASGGQRVRPTARNGKNDKNILKNNNWRGGENGMGQVGYWLTRFDPAVFVRKTCVGYLPIRKTLIVTYDRYRRPQ